MNFTDKAIATFRHQYNACPPYRRWCDLLDTQPDAVTSLAQIPFLPIEFFRTERIYSSETAPELTFSSSGTTSENTSKHFVAHASTYIKSFEDGFHQFYGDPRCWSIFGLLPGYLERPDSSLIYMVEHLHRANAERGGFFLNNLSEFHGALEKAVQNGEQIMIIGVTFALVEYASRFRTDLPSTAVVLETGGMKGRGRVIERTELHRMLCAAFAVSAIHSEYGMTEMLSQAYSQGDGLFTPSGSMAVVGRSLSNPLAIQSASDTQLVGLNIIDLSNVDSCSFLATGDQGIVHPNGTFEVHGRIEGEILRGCNMLA